MTKNKILRQVEYMNSGRGFQSLMLKHRTSDVKTIIIDARLSGLEHAGIGRYTQMLVEHLRELRTTNYELRTIHPPIRHYTLREQLEMPKVLYSEHPDLVHFPHFNVPLLYNKPFVVTIHDLLWHEQVGMNVTALPAWLYGLKYLGYRLVLRHTIMASKAIIVPSYWVSKKIIDRFDRLTVNLFEPERPQSRRPERSEASRRVERFPRVKDKVFVIYEGISDAYKGLTLPQGQTFQGEKQGSDLLKDLILLKRYGLHENQYLIYTGSLYPHKNVSLVLDILPKFPDLKFVVACSRSVFWKRFEIEIEKRGLRKKVILAGFVPDEELVVLYRHALAFVFSSLSEGFGLPGLEAMATGCPVISSNAGALPEVYAGAALYFDPKSERDLRREIERIQNEKGLREKLIQKGRERAKQFSWERCARETFEVYNHVLQ